MKRFSVEDQIIANELANANNYEAIVQIGQPNPMYDLDLSRYIDYPANVSDSRSADLQTLTSGVYLRLHANQPATLVLTDRAGWFFESFTLNISNTTSVIHYPLNVDPQPGDAVGQSKFLHEFPSPVYVQRVIIEDDSRATVLLNNAGSSVGFHPMYVMYIPVSDPVHFSQPVLYSQSAGVDVTRIEMNASGQTPLSDSLRASVLLPNRPQNIRLNTADDRVLHAVPNLLGNGDAIDVPDLAAEVNAGTDAGYTIRITSQTEAVVFIKASATRHRRAEGWTHEGPKAEAGSVILSSWSAAEIAPAMPDTAAAVRHQIAAEVALKGPVRAQFFETIWADGMTARVSLSPRLKYLQPLRLQTAAADVPQQIEGVWLIVDALPETTTVHVALREYDLSIEQPGAVLAEVNATLPDTLAEYTQTPSGHLAFWQAFPAPVPIDGPRLADFLALEVSAQDGPAAFVEVPLAAMELLAPARSLDLSRDTRWRARRFFSSPKVLLFDLGFVAGERGGDFVFLQSGNAAPEMVAVGADDKLVAELESAGPTLTLGALREAEITDLDILTRE